MIIPLNVSDNSKPGDDLLSSCKFAGDCQAILREDGSIHCTDMKLSDICGALNFPVTNWHDLTIMRLSIRGCSLWSKSTLKMELSKVWYKDAEDHLCAEPILVNKPDYSKEDE
ncbi:hypothetical protein OSTOST_08022, partial [Ostertagia ostertagi]